MKILHKHFGLRIQYFKALWLAVQAFWHEDFDLWHEQLSLHLASFINILPMSLLDFGLTLLVFRLMSLPWINPDL
jgi:hypothetical protein